VSALERFDASHSSTGDEAPGYGLHEVIVESPNHTESFSELTSQQALLAFVAYRDRLLEMGKRPGLAYGLVFKNCRSAAGATLSHTHSQILGTARVPLTVARELDSAEVYRRDQGVCFFCKLIEEEQHGPRRVLSTRRFVAFAPFASRFPFEVCVVPRSHGARFEATNLEELEDLSGLFQRIIQALEKIVPQAAYNFWIHTSPFDTNSYDYYHWHIEFIPRLTSQAGFEWGAGCFVNPVFPEDAATDLRRIGVDLND
jgi:UDPglucose--hexose-1-phosphate uridylyltransferase